MIRSPYEVTPEVAEAIDGGRPVVALESTLIAHGLPWPSNLETAMAAERAVREGGAVPATIAVLGGRVRVGLGPAELERLAGSTQVLKAGRRDLSAAVAGGVDAATTVSATLWVARRVGIEVFGTGGLGGVHRGAGSSFDVSNDLDELARADGAAVVCSGAKTLLDLPATLEALETRGVPVVGYRTDTLPGFTCRTTGLPLEHRADDPAAAARIVAAHRTLGLPGAVVIAQAVPEADEADSAAIEAAISNALAEAARLGVAGKGLSPFLLARVHERSVGESLRANVALIVANAGLAGRIATALAAADG